MSQEQKAKAYDEAIRKIKGMMPNWELLSYNGKTFLQDLINIFPELTESEDEKIRKELIEHIKANSSSDFVLFQKFSPNDVLVWLEKQGTSYTKRNVDDAFVEGMAFAKDELEKQGKQILANSEKTCKDEKKHALDIEIPFGAKDSELQEATYLIPEGFHAEIKDNEVLIKKGKQKPANWSEEDEVRLQACIDTLQAKSIMGKVDTIQTNWLRSLKQRYTWKPSKEQMDAMQMAVSYFDYSWVSKEQKLLESLYKDLKKLTEG